MSPVGSFARRCAPCITVCAAGLLAVVAGGCASTAVFTPYPQQIETVKRQLDSGQYQAAQRALDKHRDSADRILYLLERGRSSQIVREYQASIPDYKAAIAVAESNERKARITATGTMASGAAILLNDNAIPYEEKPYERVFLHHYQALNYLFTGDLEAATVEVRRANEHQELALAEHAEEVDKGLARQREAMAGNGGFMDAFSQVSEVARRVKNSFQNAYTFYVSGVIWEIAGQPNDAYIDYRKALEIFPDNRYLQRDVLRLARALSMQEDLELFEKRFGGQDVGLDPAQGELIVFFDSGYLPAKQEVKIPIYTFRGIYAVAFPTYPYQWRYTSPLTVTAAGSGALGTTSPIVNVQALAAKALQEQLPGMLTRQVLRVAAKVETTRQSGEQFGLLGSVAANIFNLVTENADLRSWLTLPNEAQILRASLPPGQHTLTLRNGVASDTATIVVEKQRRTILNVVFTGGMMRVSSVVL